MWKAGQRDSGLCARFSGGLRLYSLLTSIYDGIAGWWCGPWGFPEKDEEGRVVNSKVLSCLLSLTNWYCCSI
jgi:hypothetical protein